MRAVKAKHLRKLACVFGEKRKLPERHLVIAANNRTTAINDVGSIRGMYRMLKRNPDMMQKRAV